MPAVVYSTAGIFFPPTGRPGMPHHGRQGDRVQSGSVPAAYPMMVDVSLLPIVMVGGGAVAARKVAGLLEAGAGDITVVSPAFSPELAVSDPAGRVRRITDGYRPAHLERARLVFAATNDPAVNAAVVRDARSRGALVCRADVDEDDAGDFTTPAILRRGPVTITVSSGGSPLVTRRIRSAVESAIDPSVVTLAEAMTVLRPRVRQAIEPGQRREVFALLASDEALAQVVSGDAQATAARLWDWLAGRYKMLAGD